MNAALWNRKCMRLVPWAKTYEGRIRSLGCVRGFSSIFLWVRPVSGSVFLWVVFVYNKSSCTYHDEMRHDWCYTDAFSLAPALSAMTRLLVMRYNFDGPIESRFSRVCPWSDKHVCIHRIVHTDTHTETRAHVQREMP